MHKARDMVKLAAELNEKLTTVSSSKSISQTWSPYQPSEEPEEATFIRSSLSQLGLQISNAPVTMDMMRDERKWLEELARELGRLLQGSWNETPNRNNGAGSGGIMKNRGVIALDEVWGGWNRVRGVGMCSNFALAKIPFFSTVLQSFDPAIHILASDTPPSSTCRPSNPTPRLSLRSESPPHTSLQSRLILFASCG